MTKLTDKNILYIAILFFATVTLLYFFSRSLFLDDVDSINYALGIKSYNLSLHQPHPPGAPVYVFFAKCLNFIGFSPESSLTIIACLGGGLFVAAWFYIFSAHFNLTVSVFSSIAIALLPGLWMTSTKPMSDSLAAAFIALGLVFAIRFFQKKNNVDLFMFPIFGGLATGVRPQFGPLFLLIIAIVLLSSRSSYLIWLNALTVFAVVSLLWLIPTIISQSSIDKGGHGFFNYFYQLKIFGNRIGGTPEWSLGAGDINLGRILKKVFIHLAGCFYLSLGLNVWYPNSFNLFLAKFGTQLHPWNPDIVEWSYSGSVYFILYVAGVLFYIRSAPWEKLNHKLYWKINLLWPIFHFFMMVYAVPPSNRQYLPILPILILPAILGWQSLQKFKAKTVSIFIVILLLTNTAPLAYTNHTEPAPPVALVRFLNQHLNGEELKKDLVILGTNSGRHAQWYLKNGIKTVGRVEEKELNYYLKNGLVLTDNKHYFDKYYSNLELKEVKRFQRSIRIWNRHNRLILYQVNYSSQTL